MSISPVFRGHSKTICEQERKPQDRFLLLFAALARRALENKGIASLQQLSRFGEAEILELQGMGQSTILKLRSALNQIS